MHDQDRTSAGRIRLPMAMAQDVNVLFHLEKLVFRLRQTVLATKKISRQSHGVAITEEPPRHKRLELEKLVFIWHWSSCPASGWSRHSCLRSSPENLPASAAEEPGIQFSTLQTL